MEFPLWSIFALLCAAFSALVLILPERAQADGFALAFWNKAAAVIFMIPWVIWQGLPDQWQFYALVAAQAGLWAISDVIFFRALPVVGAGVISRILPISVIVTFVLWFFFDPALLGDYLSTPVRSALVCVALCGSVYFAMRLKHDPVSWAAIRRIWFVLFAAVIGPLMYKMVTQYTTIQQGPFAYVLFEGMIMVLLWTVFYQAKTVKPVTMQVLFAKESIRAGAIVGAAMCLVSLTKFAAMHYVDNPGLVPAVKYLDAIIVMAYYKAIGKVERADVIAGLGIVGCAAAIIVLRSVQIG